MEYRRALKRFKTRYREQFSDTFIKKRLVWSLKIHEEVQNAKEKYYAENGSNNIPKLKQVLIGKQIGLVK